MNITIAGLKGVGSVELNLQENQRVYTLIGVNGVGKTKTLEALFQVLLATNEAFNTQWSQRISKCFREITHQFPSHQLPIIFISPAVRPLPSGRGYKAHRRQPIYSWVVPFGIISR